MKVSRRHIILITSKRCLCKYGDSHIVWVVSLLINRCKIKPRCMKKDNLDLSALPFLVEWKLSSINMLLHKDIKYATSQRH